MPRLLLVSAWDVRSLDDPVPSHYTPADEKRSAEARQAIGTYYNYKLKADQELVKRSFDWTILRPGRLTDEPGQGRVDLGITHAGSVSVCLLPYPQHTQEAYRKLQREDVAAVLLALLEEPKSAGLALDLMSGEHDIQQAVQTAVENRTTAFKG